MTKRLNVTTIPRRRGIEADHLGVRRFTREMHRKMTKKRHQGYGGWNLPAQCTVESLTNMLADHLRKGDMIDIANFAMMIWNRQNPTGAQ